MVPLPRGRGVPGPPLLRRAPGLGSDNQRPGCPLTPAAAGSVLGSVPHDGPIPLDALRDLIALARSFYVTFKGMGKGYDKQVTQLTQIGTKLSRALDRAQKGGPGTWNHRTAWLLAEEATKELGDVVDVYVPAKALIAASAERLLRKR